MAHLTRIGMSAGRLTAFVLMLVLAVAIASPARADAEGVTAEHLYSGVGRPVPVRVPSAPSGESQILLLMDPGGWMLADPPRVDGGTYDLAELFPDLWTIRQTTYVQLSRSGSSVGSALVVQPMLSRLVPLAGSEHGGRPGQITGWRDEQVPPPETGAAPETDVVTSPIDAAPDVTRLVSGVRTYVERDVLMRTTHGDIRIAMRPDQAPNTVWNFRELAAGGFYRDVSFHRIVPVSASGDPFVIQAGDPTGTGEGGPGYWLPMEASGLAHDFGVVSMARADDPDSAGSQFFICLSRAGTARLDGQYCAFGYAVEGAEAILAIAEVELADVAAGRPVEPPRIFSTELVPGPSWEPGKGRPDRRVIVPRVPPGKEDPPERVAR